MINFKEEIKQHAGITEAKNQGIKAIWIQRNDNGSERTTYLKPGFTQEELNDTLEWLNFDYDNGYGSEFIHGIIWYQNGTWSKRCGFDLEHDGQQWWVHYKCPDLNEYFSIFNKKLN